jgi:hypothetical protein
MKPMIRAALLLALAAAPLAAQASFEGTVSLTFTKSDGTPVPMNYLVKEGKIRTDVPGQRGEQIGMVIDRDNRKMTMIMNSQRMYIERDLPETTTPPAAREGAARKAIVRTGKTETIAGYRCEHVTVTEDDGTVIDACVSSELGGFTMALGGGPVSTPQQPVWASQLGAVFPLRVRRGDKVIMEVTNVEKKSLDRALFEAPAGFRKLDLPAVPGMTKRP